MGDKEFKIIKLDRENYVVWKWQFTNVLKAKGLEGTLLAESNGDQAKQALALLGSALSEENILKIINCTTFYTSWKAIESCYENKTTYEPQSLYRRLNSLKIQTASEVSQGISQIRGIIAQLKNLGENVSDNCQIGAILSALPSSFDIFVTVWKNSADKNVDGLVSKLLAEASDQTSKSNEDATALAAKGKRKDKKDFDRNQCRYCREKGHWIKDCPNLKTPYDPSRGRKKNQSANQKDKNEKDNKDEDPFTMLARSCKVSNGKVFQDDIWVADSGCTNHMSPFKHLFTNLTMNNGGIGAVYLADDSSMKVEGKGEILLKNCKLTNVIYVPELGQNLFSISAAASLGVTHVGLKDKITFYRNKKEVFTAFLRNNLYLIKLDALNVQRGSANAATLRQWHARFGHVSTEAIKWMEKHKIVEGLEIVTNHQDKCEDCKLNKCTRANHPSRTSAKANVAGNVLHLDTAGPSSVPSRANSKYFVLCKDEASQYRQVAFVQTKDQISNKVKEFISKAMLETGNPVLKIITDNGSEFVNKNLSKFLEEKGILHERSVPYTPAQNGYIERDIRTIKEAAKTMLNSSSMEKNLWPDAISCAIYTLNRVVNATNKMNTPYESWFKTKPNVKNIRVFGEVVVLRKPESQVDTSWDQKGSKGIFIGYTERFNTYRILQLDNNRITITCDVVFLNRMFNGKEIPKEDPVEDFWTSANTPMCVDENYVNVSRPRSIDNHGQSEEIDLDTSFESVDTVEVRQERPLPPVPSSQHEVPPQQPTAQVQIQQVAPAELTNSEIQAFVNTYKNQEINISQGDTTTKLLVGDIVWSGNTRRWKNGKTGHFLAKDTIRSIYDCVTRRSRATVAKAMLASVVIPKNFEEAISSEFSEQWKEAMEDEMNSMIKNQVFETISEKYATKKPVGSRWVYTVKYKKNNEIDKFKARIVAKGYSQIYGVDYLETYCSVVQVMTTRLVLSYAAKENLYMRQFDIKTAFLYGRLNEEIFMTPPEGFSQPNTLWKLQRSLYGLKQSPRMWNEKFSSFMKNSGLEMSKYDNSVFYQMEPLLIIIVYVDDGLIFARDESSIVKMLEKLKDKFEMREMDVNVYRGIEIVKQEDGIFVHQAKYTQKILEVFNMSNAKQASNPAIDLNDEEIPLEPDKPYRNAVGSLAYLADTTRPDIAFAVNQLARKMAAPSENDWKRVKQVFRYLVGTINMGIKYQRNVKDQRLVGYSDSDFAGNKATSKSTTGYVIMFNEAPFHWKTQLQRHVTLSSTEAEVIALCALSKELAWIRRMLIELNMLKEGDCAVIMCDNQSALKIVTSEKATARTRHLRAQDAYVREQILEEELELYHVKSELQQADLLTKITPTGKFIANRNRLLCY